MSVQEGYREDMGKYKSQVEDYMLRLKGINPIADSDLIVVRFSLDGESHKLIINKDDDVDSSVRAKMRQIKEMYCEEEADTTRTK